MKYLSFDAAVFAIGKNYNIIFNTEETGLAWVEIEGIRYYDTDNGNIKSNEYIHKIEIPMEILDHVRKYKIGFRRAFERKHYFPTSEDTEYTKEYVFYPVEKKDSYNFYMIADTHTRYICPSESGRYFGDELDFLILNGDIADGSVDSEQILTTHRIAANVVKGEKPVIFVRGNHDTRGAMACELSKYIPVKNGKTYYTFEIGNIFGICLDCGEDKPDNHPEYGLMADFEAFRKEETKFIKKVIEDAEYSKYDYVLAICHIRIPIYRNKFFKETYNEWLELLNVISPDIMLCGHEHKCYFLKNDAASFDDETKRTTYPVVVGSCYLGSDDFYNKAEKTDFHGTAITMDKNKIDIRFTNAEHDIIENHICNREL